MGGIPKLIGLWDKTLPGHSFQEWVVRILHSCLKLEILFDLRFMDESRGIRCLRCRNLLRIYSAFRVCAIALVELSLVLVV